VRPTSAELQQVRATAESRIAMLRQRCQEALGPKWFGPVHEYLTEVRAGEGWSRATTAAPSVCTGYVNHMM
jgi:hypothetical protein